MCDGEPELGGHPRYRDPYKITDPGVWQPSPTLYVACASHRGDADTDDGKVVEKSKLPFGFVAPAQETAE